MRNHSVVVYYWPIIDVALTIKLNQRLVSKPSKHLCLSHIQPRAPYDFHHPYDFLPVRPSEAPVGFLRRCCYRGHIRLRAPYGLTRLCTCGLVEWFAGLHGYPVRCPCGGGGQNSCGAARGPCGPREWTYDFFFKTAREQPVRGPGVWCDWGISSMIST